MDLTQLVPDEQGMIVLPGGTVTMTIDQDAGVLRIYSEPEPDPADWQLAMAYVGQVVVRGSCPSGEVHDGCVDVFTVSTRLLAKAG